MNYQPTFSTLPKPVQNAVEFIVKNSKPNKLILFGSRARGTHRENSDYDFAIKSKSCDDTVWARILVELQEGLFTLHNIELVEYEKLNKDYQKSIDTEGKIIYG